MAHRIRTLLENGRAFLEHASIHLVLPEILDKIIADTQAERAQIVLYDGGGGVVFKSARNKAGKDLLDHHESRISRKIVELVKTSQQAVVTSNAMADPLLAEPERAQTTIIKQRLLSVACVPLRDQGQTFGVLYIDNREEQARFNEETGRQLFQLADLLAGSLKKSLDFTLTQQEERERRESHLRALRQQLDRLLGHEEIIGNCPAMLALRQDLDFMKDHEFTVLILGDTGTGKELVAKALHRTSARHGKPFVACDCSAVPENMLESQLFGHERGAFTDARQSNSGIIHEAEGGTLFLDEIGNLSLETQKKLLRFLETKTYRRLGAAQERRADVRLIFATNKNLPEMVAEKKFMLDLHFRLHRGRTITLPPLRERGEDILLLAEAFLSKYNREYQTNARFSMAARALLMAYAYPGNVRELDSLISGAAWEALRTRSEVIEPEHLRHLTMTQPAPDAAPPATSMRFAGGGIYAHYLPEEHLGLLTGQYAPPEASARAAQIVRQHELHERLFIDASRAVGMPFLQARDAVAGVFERSLLAVLMLAAQGVQKDAIALAQIDEKTFITKMKEHGIKKEWFADLKPGTNPVARKT